MTAKSMRFPVMLAALICAASCAHRPEVAAPHPPRADLEAAPEPLVPPEALSSEKAANAYDAAVLTWGRGLEAQVGRLCRWAKAAGMTDAPCGR